MCGQVGVFGHVDDKARDAFWNLLIFSQVRGMHSTGIAKFKRREKDALILKDVGVPTDLCQFKKFDEIFNKDYSTSCLIGHNRSKTFGDISRKNAHPFQHGKIVGAHNGTLMYKSKNALEGKDKVFDTDSEGIFYSLDKNGVEDTLFLLEGAWSLVWVNTEEGKLYITRNSQRDLYYTYTNAKKQMFWSSEHWFLTAALQRNNLKPDDIYIFKPDHLYEFKIPGYMDAIESPTIISYEDLFKKVTINKEEPKAEDSGVFSRASRAVIHMLEGPKQHTVQGSKLCSPLTGKIEYNDLYKADFALASQTCNGQGYTYVGKANTRMYVAQNKNLVAKKHWEKLAENGCSWCNANPSWGDHVEFIDKDAFICSECLLSDEVKKYLVN